MILQLWPAGQPMSQFWARHTTGEIAQESLPKQSTVQELPAQSTPPWQALAAHEISQDEALPQSTTALLHAWLPHSTRQGMPAGQ